MDAIGDALARLLQVESLPPDTKLQDLPAFRDLADAIASDSVVCERLDHTVYVGNGNSSHLTAASVATALFERASRRMGFYKGPLFKLTEQEAIEDLVRDLHASMMSDTCDHVCCAILSGCGLEDAYEGIKYGDARAAFRGVSLDEVEYMLVVRPTFGMEVQFGLLAIELRWTGQASYCKKGDRRPSGKQHALPPDLQRRIEHLAHCVRALFYPHPPEVLGFVRYWDHFSWRESFESWGVVNRTAEHGALYAFSPFGGWSTVQGISELWSPSGPPMERHVIDQDVLKDIERLLTSGKQLEAAVRRLSTALVRRHREDMLVDLAIVLENALQQVDLRFLNSVAAADRLALAAAALMKNDAQAKLAPRTAYKIVSELHRRRNAVVHGSSSSATVSLDDVRATREILLACAKGVTVPSKGSGLAGYLLDLMDEHTGYDDGDSGSGTVA